MKEDLVDLSVERTLAVIESFKPHAVVVTALGPPGRRADAAMQLSPDAGDGDLRAMLKELSRKCRGFWAFDVRVEMGHGPQRCVLGS